MHVSIAKLLATLSISTSVLAAPSDPKTTRDRSVSKRALKQATRDSIISRARNPFRRQAATSCGTCSDCCPLYCRSSGQVENAVYENTGIPASVTPINSIGTSFQDCMNRCHLTDCTLVRYISGSCTLYRLNSGGDPTYTTESGSKLAAINTKCADNTANAGTRACCNAPFVVGPPV